MVRHLPNLTYGALLSNWNAALLVVSPKVIWGAEAPLLWNQLPVDVWEVVNLSIFNSRFLFDKAYF